MRNYCRLYPASNSTSFLSPERSLARLVIAAYSLGLGTACLVFLQVGHIAPTPRPRRCPRSSASLRLLLGDVRRGGCWATSLRRDRIASAPACNLMHGRSLRSLIVRHSGQRLVPSRTQTVHPGQDKQLASRGLAIELYDPVAGFPNFGHFEPDPGVRSQIYADRSQQAHD
jgi:hypothetical protein